LLSPRLTSARGSAARPSRVKSESFRSPGSPPRGASFRSDVIEIGVDRGAVPPVGAEREGVPVPRQTPRLLVSLPPSVSLFRPEPSGARDRPLFMPAARASENASHDPAGDQDTPPTGSSNAVTARAIRRGRDVKICGIPVMFETNAMRFPSGEKLGPSRTRPGPSRRRTVPAPPCPWDRPPTKTPRPQTGIPAYKNLFIRPPEQLSPQTPTLNASVLHRGRRLFSILTRTVYCGSTISTIARARSARRTGTRPSRRGRFFRAPRRPCPEGDAGRVFQRRAAPTDIIQSASRSAQGRAALHEVDRELEFIAPSIAFR